MRLEEKILSHAGRLRGTVGVAIKSLTRDYSFFINAHETFHAASIIKVPIIIELYRQAGERILSLDEEVILRDGDKIDGAGILMEMHSGLTITLRDCARLMIVISDNTASNILIDRLGPDSINECIRRLGMNGTWLRKKFMIPLSDPSIINVTTPFDTMVMLEKLYGKEILSPSMTDEVIGILCRQQYNEKIPLLLPEGLQIAHKTGEVTGVRHDTGIVFLRDNPYAICVLTKNVADHLEADRVIAEISRDTHDFFAAS